MARSKTLRGLDSLVFVNGRLYAVCSKLSWEIDYGSKANYGIDSQVPFEIQSTRSRISGSAACFRLHSDAGLEGAGIAPIESEMSRERYFYLQVVDRQSDQAYLDIPKAKIIAQSWETVARGVVQGTFRFEGLGWANEF